MTMNLKAKYAPQCLDDVVFNDANNEVFLKAIEARQLHTRGLLFYGPTGTGKTLCAELIAKALTGNGGLLLSHSIADFLAIKELESYLARHQIVYGSEGMERCVIIFNEVDKYEKSLAPLWTAMDDCSERLLVIATTNNAAKLERPFLSRTDKYEFKRVTAEQYAQRAQQILEAEGLSLSVQEVTDYLNQYTSSVSAVSEFMQAMEKMLLLHSRGSLPPLPSSAKVRKPVQLSIV